MDDDLTELTHKFAVSFKVSDNYYGIETYAKHFNWKEELRRFLYIMIQTVSTW